jgi:Amt family ammonium transporter
MGHGLVDAGGSGQVVLIGACGALAALLIFRDKPATDRLDATEAHDTALEDSPDQAPAADEPETVPMPPVHLPLLGLLGATLMMVGWMGMGFMGHLPTAVDTLSSVVATNLVLGALGGALSVGLYSWFTTSHLNPLMSARGLVAGLVVTAASAPFIPAWSALAAGLVIGFFLPLLIYLFDRVLRLDDRASALGTFGLPAILGLLLPALVANGRYGVGWNGGGEETYLDVAGQGVSGLLVANGFAADWPGQFYAQLIGAVAIFAWSFGLSWLLMQILVGIVHAWERSGLEFGAPPKPVSIDDEAPATQDKAPQQTQVEAPVPDEDDLLEEEDERTT